MLINQKTFNLRFKITDDWGGSHRVVLDLEALSTVTDWKVGISLPDNYEIDRIYNAEIITENGKTYISGVDWNKNIKQGETTEVILIVDEGNNSNSAPKLPKLFFADSIEEFNNKDWSQSNSLINSDSEITENWNDGRLAIAPKLTSLSSQADGQKKVINVDNDFGGDLERAVATANDGDVVRLGSNTYYTEGFTVNKDIIIDGQEGSKIDGSGTKEAIIKLTPEATGATIQNVEITNGNIGINSYGAFDLMFKNLNLNNIGISRTIRGGQNNTAINLNRADGTLITNSKFFNIGRKGIGIGDTDGATIEGVTVENINLAAQHSQIHDAAGIKFFNTNKITVRNSHFNKINAFGIWNDTTNATTIVGNVIEDAGDSFKAPSFNKNVDIAGIYNEKSSNSIVKNNQVTSVDKFSAFQATEFSTETMILEGNNFSSMEVNTQDYWVNKSAEKLIAVIENPDEANFNLFANDYYAQANIS